MADLDLKFAQGSTKFTVHLLKKLKAFSSNENIVVSPFLIQTCLALLYSGAQGDTAKEIADSLKHTVKSPSEVGHFFQNFLKILEENELLTFAHRLYVQEGKNINSEYAKEIKDIFHTEIEPINFSNKSQSVHQIINQWIETETKGQIKNLIEGLSSLNGDTRWLLVNTLYFKGIWKQKFAADCSYLGNFWTMENKAKKIVYMYQTSEFNYGYFKKYNCSALEMFYKDSDLSMLVLLPTKRDGLAKLGKKLKDINLFELVHQMGPENVTVIFPKFKIDCGIELSRVLQKMGLKKAFGPHADFGNFLDCPEPISNIFHKTHIEVNEQGFEPDDNTMDTLISMCFNRIAQFIANHPFFYWIWNRREILIAGTFVDVPAKDRN
ncbi:serine protease inhibitor 42Dd-like [Haematobia irritans]|uniref:serine protease inhibitor 42Dd-like n=1 Tax=Haematobia irritans TaxID=7368 RepID=UPI003F504002